MKSHSACAAGSRALLWLIILLLSLFTCLSSSQDGDECQPYRWDSDSMRVRAISSKDKNKGATITVEPGEVNCRYWAATSDEVSYYTCTQLASRYDLHNHVFFSLNPALEKDCSNIEPQTEYCVAGCELCDIFPGVLSHIH